MLASEKVQGQVGLGVAEGQESRNRTRSEVNGWAWNREGESLVACEGAKCVRQVVGRVSYGHWEGFRKVRGQETESFQGWGEMGGIMSISVGT